MNPDLNEIKVFLEHHKTDVPDCTRGPHNRGMEYLSNVVEYAEGLSACVVRLKFGRDIIEAKIKEQERLSMAAHKKLFRDAVRWKQKCEDTEAKLFRAVTEIEKTITESEAEPLALGEPAESVQIGRLQIADELRSSLVRINGGKNGTT